MIRLDIEHLPAGRPRSRSGCGGRAPAPPQRTQIASAAVSDLQNIGDYCVWMYSDPHAAAAEEAVLREWFTTMLNDATGDVAQRLDALIPQEWTAKATEDYQDGLTSWKREGEGFAADLETLNGRQAAVLEAIMGQAESLVEGLKAQRAKLYGEPPTKESLQRLAESVLQWGAGAVQELEEEMLRAEPQEQQALPARSSSRRCVRILPRPRRTGPPSR